MAVVGRDDAHSFLVVKASGKVIDDKAVDPSADKANHNDIERVDSESCAADNCAGDGDRCTNIEM